MAGRSSRAHGWDDGLDPEAMEKADAEWLGAERPPGRHFRRRLRLLVHALNESAASKGRADEDRQALSHGRLTVPHEDDGEDFVHLETVALLHQVAEAAWSLLFALAPDVRSPMLFLGQLKTGELRGRVRKAKDDPANLDRLLRHVLLVDEHQPGERYRVVAEERLPAVRRLLLITASRLDDDRRLHNAIKHGFAVTTSRALIGFTLHDPSDLQPGDVPDVDLGRNAIWMTVLEQRDDPRGTRSWTVTRTALNDLDQELWAVLMLTSLLDAFWDCARARRGHGQQVQLRLPTDADVDVLNDQPPNTLRKAVFDTLYAGDGSISCIFYADRRSATRDGPRPRTSQDGDPGHGGQDSS